MALHNKDFQADRKTVTNKLVGLLLGVNVSMCASTMYRERFERANRQPHVGVWISLLSVDAS